MSESLFNKTEGLHACNYIKKKFHHRCFFESIAKLLRRPILNDTCEWLLLDFAFSNREACWYIFVQYKEEVFRT